MFILTLCCPLFLLSLIWNKFNTSSRSIFRFIFWIFFSLYFTSFYLNGVDWSIYYLKFLTGENPYLSFEIGFVFFFEFLLFITLHQFGMAILLFYLIAFGSLISVVKKFKVNEPMLFMSIFLIFGYTLILEQLRQFIACIIILYAFLKYSEGHSLKVTFFWVLIASSFHISSLIAIPTFLLLSIRSVTMFSISIISLVCGVVISLFAGSALIDILGGYSFAFKKISFYVQQTPLTLAFGWLNMLDFLYIFFYYFYRKKIDKDENISLFTRVVFIGAVIHVFSGSVTFFSRLGFVYYFVAVILFTLSPYSHRKRYFAIKSYSTLLIAIFFATVLFFNFSSYFRNPASPVEFSNMSFDLVNLFDNVAVYKLANEKFLEALKDSLIKN